VNRIAFAALMLVGAAASAQMTQEQRERCATRLSVNLLGVAPNATLLSAPNPQNEVPNLLEQQQFIDRFSAYINARFNPEPDRATREPAYFLARKVLTEKKPWKEMFVGQYSFTRLTPQDTTSPPVIADDPNGLGYFMSADWRARFAGNELEGYRLVHAYRVLNNVLGFELAAAVNTDGITAEGRKAATCSGCHYHPYFGLDLIARVLPKRGQNVPAQAPQMLLGGKTINNERELVQAMVDSPDFAFNVCRTAMVFAYGRAEFKCEGPVFDACMTAFAAQSTMQSALSAVLRHPTYCQ
jgi:hypothetical protein